MQKMKLVMNTLYPVPGSTYIVEVDKIDQHGYHGLYKLEGDKTKYGHSTFKWEHIFRMEKIEE